MTPTLPIAVLAASFLQLPVYGQGVGEHSTLMRLPPVSHQMETGIGESDPATASFDYDMTPANNGDNVNLAIFLDENFAQTAQTAGSPNHLLPILQVSAMQPIPSSRRQWFASELPDPGRFSAGLIRQSSSLGVGVDFYSAPDFTGGLIIVGDDVAMKIGGYVKADFIYDFNPIDSTDTFDTTTIAVRAPPRTNARFHARQSRLSFDTRWASDGQAVKIFVEGDFFSESDRFRLRHAYGEVGSLLVGRTWTTFTDVSAAPATLDFEGSVSSVNRRQALARWTQPLAIDGVTFAFAVEDTRFIIVPPMGVTGDSRSPSPDFVARLRLDRDWGQFQLAHVYRIGGFQPTGQNVVTGSAWGFNFTGSILVTEQTKAYYQILFGDGIGSYRGLPDAAPSGLDRSELLSLFGWMIGVTHEWNDHLSSNFTYAENELENTAFQEFDDVHRTSYLAANLIWKPLDRVSVGAEYLYGVRQDVDGASGAAHRMQMAFIFDLP